MRTNDAVRVIHLRDAADARVSRFANLRHPTAKVDEDTFVVEGRFCLQRLLASSLDAGSILVERGKESEVANWHHRSIPVYTLPPDEIRRLVGFDFHRGMLGCGTRPKLHRLDELRFQPGHPPIALAVLGVDHQENLGSMMRTAAALGIGHLLIGPATADPYSRRTIRVSMATVFGLRLYELDRPASQLSELHRLRNIRTIATTLDRDATSLDQMRVDPCETVLIVGNESKGIDDSVQQIATDRVTLPMKLGTDSLNVSIAATIFMYELVRDANFRANL